MTYKWGIVDEHRKLLYVTAIIDATHFRGVWHGQQFEVRCLPDSSSVTVGDLVFTHVLPGNSELVAIFPSLQELWLSPGAVPAGGNAELWKYTGIGNPILQWAAPNAYDWITLLVWTDVTHKLYMWVWEGENQPTRLYEVNTSTGISTLILSYNAGRNPPVEAAEFNNKIYCLHSYCVSGGWTLQVWRFDPVTETVEYVLPPPTATYDGGIGVLGNKIYVDIGLYLYESISGDVGSWNLVITHTSPLQFVEGGCVLFDNALYFPGSKFIPPMQEWHNVFKYDGLAWSIDREVPGPELYQTAGVFYPVGIDESLFVGQPGDFEWGYGDDLDPDLFVKPKGGAWAVDSPGLNDTDGWSVYSWSPQGPMTLNGILYFFWNRYPYQANAKAHLFKRNAIDDWSQVYEWEGYTKSAWDAHTVIRTGRKVHEI